jgi:hypothetical protein
MKDATQKLLIGLVVGFIVGFFTYYYNPGGIASKLTSKLP